MIKFALHMMIFLSFFCMIQPTYEVSVFVLMSPLKRIKFGPKPKRLTSSKDWGELDILKCKYVKICKKHKMHSIRKILNLLTLPWCKRKKGQDLDSVRCKLMYACQIAVASCRARNLSRWVHAISTAWFTVVEIYLRIRICSSNNFHVCVLHFLNKSNVSYRSRNFPWIISCMFMYLLFSHSSCRLTKLKE